MAKKKSIKSYKADSLRKNIKDLRTKAGLNQKELGDKMGIDQKVISSIESGRRTLSAEELVKLSEIYNISLDEIVNSDSPQTEGKLKESDGEYNVELKKGKEIVSKSEGKVTITFECTREEAIRVFQILGI